MTVHLIGDLQGCDDALARLLDTLAFDPASDRLIVLGDAVNRGPGSAAVLRRLMALGDAAQCLLGNHDLHLLAVAEGVRRAHRSDTIADILSAPDRDALLDWVRRRPLALFEQGWLLVHAGVLPQWTVARTLELAAEVESGLRSGDLGAFLGDLFGNEPARWSEDLQGPDRWRITINALTRLRFVHADGAMDFHCKQDVGRAAAGLMPWFAHPHRLTAQTPIAFGHWSTLGLRWSHGTLCLDSGCLWGGALSAARLAPPGQGWVEVTALPCARAMAPMLDA